MSSKGREGLGTSGSMGGGGGGGWVVDGWLASPKVSSSMPNKVGILLAFSHPKVHDLSHKLPQIEERPTYPS